MPPDDGFDDAPVVDPPELRAIAGGRAAARKRAPAQSSDFERGDHVELGDRLLKELRGDGDPLVFDEGSLYRYAPPRGVWDRILASQESVVVQSFAGSSVDGRKAPLKIRSGDVTGASQLAHDVASTLGHFADAPAGIAFANGFVHVDTEGVHLAPHAAEHRARLAIDLDHDPLARCPRWIGFLGWAFAPLGDDRDVAIDLLGEFAGACLLGLAPRYQRAVVMIGDGNNGKNVVIDVICSMFPPDARAAIAPQTWTQEYQRAQLVGVRINAVSELPEADILESEAFKAIVTGDQINARPIRQAPFSFRPISGHLFAANALPGTNDLTDGFWRRMVVLSFENHVDAATRDAGLATGIVEAERAGILSWMLAGAHRLIARRGYVMPKSSAEAVAEWRRSADNVGQFLSEWTDPVSPDVAATSAHWERSARLYGSYRAWAMSCGYRPVSIKKFASRAKILGFAAAHSRDGTIYPLTLRTGAPS